MPRKPASVILDPIPEKDEPEKQAPATGAALPTPRTRTSAARPTAPDRAASPSPRATQRLLDRLLAPLNAGAGTRRPVDPGEKQITVEHRSDPAGEAAIKRRLEKQVTEKGGDRLRWSEVMVKGRTIHIRARATRFWLRRSLRRSLENLALPAGYQAEVEIVD
jgi:hypothetical protein